MRARNEIAALNAAIGGTFQCPGKIDIRPFKIELERGAMRSRRDRPPTFCCKPNAPAGFVFTIKLDPSLLFGRPWFAIKGPRAIAGVLLERKVI